MLEGPANWQMLSTIKKCKVVQTDYNNRRSEYFMNETRLQNVNEENDLGVFIRDECNAGLSNLSAMAGRIDFILGVAAQYAVAALALQSSQVISRSPRS